MFNIESLNSVYLILVFIVPGMVMIFIRSRFLTGRISHAENFLSYLALSVVYYAVILPIISYVMTVQDGGYQKAILWLGIIFVGPSVIGLLMGLDCRLNWSRDFLRWCGLNPVHIFPTAWDWRLHNLSPHFVIVVLKNGLKYFGYYGGDSFISSDPNERDLYLTRLYDKDNQNNWTLIPGRTILITAGEISTIEFLPDEPRRDTDGRQGSADGKGSEAG